MNVHTRIEYSDLSYEKKEELISWVKQLLIEDWLDEGVNILGDNKRKWYVKPRSKEEAYCRLYDIGSQYWSGIDEKSQEFKDFDWVYQFINHAEKEAEKKIFNSFKYLEVEIELL